MTADATVISDHYNADDPLYQQCRQPSIRTTSLVQQKDAVKASAMGSCRVYAMIRAIKAWSEEEKSGLGLHIDDTTPTPVPTTA